MVFANVPSGDWGQPPARPSVLREYLRAPRRLPDRHRPGLPRCPTRRRQRWWWRRRRRAG